MNYAYFPDFLSNFLFAPNTKWQFSGCVALICDCLVQHNSYHFPVSHWDGSMTYRVISVSHWLVWITYRARPLREAVNVYNNIYIFFYMFLRHYPYSCFLSLFIFFRVCVWKQETRVHPSHQRRKSDKQTGFGAWTHPSQVFTEMSQMASNGEPLVQQKSERWTLFI